MRFDWITDDSRAFLANGYLPPHSSAEERLTRIATIAQEYLPTWRYFRKRLLEYFSKGWISLSSPIWANFGRGSGLPISCNGSVADDSVVSILDKVAEIGMMTKLGAGTSIYLGKLRPRGAPIMGGGKSFGPVHFAELFDKVTEIISQSSIRRGRCAAYLDVESPDIEEFLRIREEGHPIQELSIGVCIGDAWMEEMLAGKPENRAIWARIIRKRYETGYPYLFFRDNVRKGAPPWYANMPIVASNLCSEITLPSSPEESFVCCLSSLNLAKFEEWYATPVVQDLVAFLDAVMEEYIRRTENIPHMRAAHRFARRHRAIGLGVLGWHSLLQSNGIAFDSAKAFELTETIFKWIHREANLATRRLAEELGGCEVAPQVRNATLMAIAPTFSSSIIMGNVSPSIEPYIGNTIVRVSAKGIFHQRNPYLEKVLEDWCINTEETWDLIAKCGGSVKALNLPQEILDVFKTFGEISQEVIIDQAIARQKYIDQAQSINLMIHPETPPKVVSDLLIKAWRGGLKTLYYQRSYNPSQELLRALSLKPSSECSACEG